MSLNPLKRLLWVIGIVSLQACALVYAGGRPARWTINESKDWAQTNGWLVGCNFIPSTAVNQLEMWQADTFDTDTIDRELGWAQQLGFNCVRVFLHDLLWKQDAQGFLQRINLFLDIADKHQIKAGFVFFDSCWNPDPRLGGQPAPRLFVHNSGWVQSPGREYMAHPEKLAELKPYVQGVIERFRNDRRIAFWDVYNEPDNMNVPAYSRQEPAEKSQSALALLKLVFVWAREARPSQPLTSGIWHGDWSDPAKLSAFEKVQLGQSDITSFHSYGNLEAVKYCVNSLRRYGRPIICTEYMARPLGSTFDPILGYFKAQKVGAFNWGFVSGKTQTIFPWDSWVKTYTNQPPVWFHDIFYSNGQPYKESEVRYIRKITSAEEPSGLPEPQRAAAPPHGT